MPSPIGHALAGIAIAGACGRAEASRRDIGFLVLCATAPDLDLLLRWVDGANHHRGPSHSLGAALILAIAVFLLRRFGLKTPSGWLAGLAWASHVALDYVGVDTSPPFGEMALWPVSDGFYIAPVFLFYDVPRSFTEAAIRHNLLAVGIEILVLLPVAALGWRRPAP